MAICFSVLFCVTIFVTRTYFVIEREHERILRQVALRIAEPTDRSFRVLARAGARQALPAPALVKKHLTARDEMNSAWAAHGCRPASGRHHQEVAPLCLEIAG